MKKITMLFFVTLAATLMWTPGNAQTDLPLLAQKATIGALSSGNDTVNLYNISADDTNSVVFEQTEGGGNGIVSDYFVPLQGGAYSSDDFTLADETDIHLFKFQGFAADEDGMEPVLDGFQLFVYADDGGAPAGYPSGPDAAILELDLDWDAINGPDDGLSYEKVEEDGFWPVYIVTIDVEEATGEALTLSAGSYWVVIAAKINGPTGGVRFNWSSSLDMNGELPKLSDPQALFGSDENWLDINILTAGTDFNALAFTVYGPPLDACTGAVAGTVVGDTEIEVCALSSFSMSVEGNSDPATGLISTWQSSPAGAGTWTDLGVSSSTITIAGIDTPTDYRYHVECDNGDSDDSEVIEVSLNPNPSECYCTPEGTNSARYIDNFTTTGGVENISNLGSGFSPGGYGDFTAMTVEANPGEELSFTADVEGGTAGFRIWVDWNQDGAFDATEEVAYQSAGYLDQHTGAFTVPTDAMGGTTRMRVVSHWLSTSGDVDPCETGFTYGEFEDYTFEIIPLDTCTGAVAGTIVGDTEIEVCALASFSMSVEGNSDPATGLIRTWQSSPAGAGTWTDLGVGSSTITIAGIDTPTDYRYHVECDNGDSDNSDVIEVSLNPNPSECYCTPEGTNSARYIDNFATTGGVENISNLGSGFSPGGYGDFTAMTVEANPGDELSFTADVEGGTAGIRIWVDWNQDGEFDTAEEVAYQSAGYIASHSGSFTIPMDAVSGDTRMRVVSHWLSTSGDVDPCETGFTYGEFEDYTIVVGELDDCSGTPDGGVASVNPESGNINTSYTVSAIDYTSGNGVTYQWQSNTDGAGWVDEGGLEEHYAAFNATAPAENGIDVEWRLEVTCTFSQETSYSETATFTTTSVLVYCTPELDCVDGDMITNVTFQEIDNTTACSPNGYGDYTAMAATVQAGETYPISVSVGDGWAYESVSVWIDFDNSGTFEEDEFFYIGTGSDEALTGDISIPTALADGNYRMRVRVAADGEVNTTWDLSCDEDQGFGETEDYTVTVDGVVGTDDHALSGFTYYPNPTSDMLNLSSDKNIEDISVFNMLGQKVVTSTVGATSTEIDFSALAVGTYVMKVTIDGQVGTYKVIKN